METGFRIEEEQFRAWTAAVVARQSIRGVAAVAKEMEAHVAKRVSDGHVAVARHQLFSWAELLESAASRDPRASSAGAELSLAQVASDMRAILGGKAAGSASPPAASRPTHETRVPQVAPYAPATYVPPAPAPAISYSSTAPSGGAEVRFVGGAECADAVRRFIQGARGEIWVVSPWQGGIETLADELLRLPPTVKIRLLGRPPQNQDSNYHNVMNALGRRGAITTWSPALYTRMMIRDRQAACIGAAGVALSGEAALITTDPAAVAGAVAHFERVIGEATRK